MGTPLASDRLKAIPFFQGLPDDALAALSGRMRPVTVRAGVNLIAVEQPGEVLYVVLAGTVKVYVEQADGTEVILAILGPGEIVGEMSVVDSLHRSASVVTLEDSTLARIDRRAFWDALQANPQLTTNLVMILSRRLRLANTRVQADATLDVVGRVALQLLALAQELGQPEAAGRVRIPIRLSQADLAGLVGASRVRVNQVIVDFKREGYLTIDRRLRVTIRDQRALRGLVGDDLLAPDPS